ncbi:sensor domain-containing diguanylate cyclase [Vibrio kyushuensis]|uniref:sensor domain-containing diguanylate cyclase n=1 Tax=Vibrio kyushuensis TaxID=2910249 RepID=UPI003D12DE40
MTDKICSLKAEIEGLKSQVRTLKKHEKQLELVIKSTGVGIWDWYVQEGKTEFNERWANIIGYTLDELSPVSIDTWLTYAHPDDLIESERLLKEHWAGRSEYYIFESRMKHKSGRWIWVYDTGQVIEWESEGVPKRMIGTHLDITKEREAMAKLDAANKALKELSYMDSLTDIPNRRAYLERLSEEISIARRSNTPLSMLMIDIDHFKQYNDTFGHEKGDIALFQIAQCIKHELPRKTDFVARFGGEEIIAILPHTDPDGAVFAARKILEAVMAENIEHTYSQHENKLTVSIGVATCTDHYETLLDKADAAMYCAKELGRNQLQTYNKK